MAVVGGGVGHPEPLAGRGGGHAGIDGGDDVHEGIEHVVADAGRPRLLDAVPGADLAAPGHGHGQPDEVLLPIGQQRRVVGVSQISDDLCVIVGHARISSKSSDDPHRTEHSATVGRVSHSQRLPQVHLQDIELPVDKPAVAAGAGQHDRAFHHAHDEAGQLRRTFTRCPALRLRGGLEVGLEFPGHLIEAVVEAFAEAVVSVAQGGTEVPDDAAAPGVLPAADHLRDGIQTSKDRSERPVVAHDRERHSIRSSTSRRFSICWSITAKASSSLPLK